MKAVTILSLAITALAALPPVGCTSPAGRETAPAGAVSAALFEKPLADVIVFSSNRGGPYAIWAIKPDGTGLRQITHPDEGQQDVDPCISPDGRSILLTSTRGGKAGIWRMAANGDVLRRICDGDQGEWSPFSEKGGSIVFRRGGAIVTRELAGGAERTVSPTGQDKCSSPAWSPDGKSIAFAVLGPQGNAIHLAPATGVFSKESTIIYDRQGACEPHWSPDGLKIVYETEAHLFTINPDGTKNRPLTYYGGVQRFGRFSPDGTKVVFCQAPAPEGPWELYIVASNGVFSKEPVQLTRGGSDMYPDWK